MAKKEYIYATGKRKSSIARVNIIPGTGKITINKKDLNDFYTLDSLKAIVLKPFTVTNLMEKYDVVATEYKMQYTYSSSFGQEFGAKMRHTWRTENTTDRQGLCDRS